MKGNTLKAEEKRYSEYVLEKIEQFNGNGKMTVALYCDSFFPDIDGVVMVIDNLAKKLNKICNVIAFVPRHNGKTYKSDYLVVGVKSKFIKSLNYSVAMPLFDKDYKKAAKAARIDIIHCHSPFFMGKAAKRLHKSKNIPMVTSFHSQFKQDFYKVTKSKALTAVGLKYIMPVFNAGDEVWTMTEKGAEVIRDYGYKGEIKLIPNATDFAYPSDGEKRAEVLRRKYGITDEKILLFVGRLVLQKNILFLAEVIKKLKDKGDKIKMFFVGDGPDRGKLEEKISALRLQNECVLIGFVEDRQVIADYYLFADIVLFPSMYDNSSIVQIEAACMKKPTVFAQGSVTSYTVTDGVNGFILPNEADTFADGVHKIINNEKELKTVGENACRDLYITWDGIAARVYDGYREIIEKHKKNN